MDQLTAPPQPALYRPVGGVESACEYIEQHLAEAVSLDDLARASGYVNRFALSRAFTRALGLPPHAYLISIRIARGRALLDQGILPSRAAADLGFADQSHFARHFLRLTGVTPGAYLRARTF